MARVNDNDPAADAAQHASPPSSTTGEDIVARASGGRLLLRLLAIVVALAVLGGGGWFGRKLLRARSVRSEPMAALPAQSVTIGNDWRGRDDAPAAAGAPAPGALEERPAHPVTVPGFAIDKSEVTVAAYRICFEDGGCAKPASGKLCNWDKADRDAHPMNCVTYPQAEAFCQWAKKRLPTEIEWEYAAGGASPKRVFPWGDDLPGPGHANVCGAECTAGARPTADLLAGLVCNRKGECRPRLFDYDDRFPETAPVGSFPGGTTPEGVTDMAGNVWEWTSSAPCSYPAHECADTGERVVRGGGWTHRYLLSPEVTTREKLPTSIVSDGVGFRCAR